MSAVVPIARPHALAAPPQRAHNKIRLAAQMAAPFFANTAQAARCCSRARHLRPTHLATPMRSTRCVNLQCGQATQLRTAQAALRNQSENRASGCENPVCEIDAWTHAEHHRLPFGRSVWHPVEYGGEANEVIRYMPGIVCQNVDGLSSSLRACLLSILKIHASNPIFAACLQEHHLTRAKIAELDAEAEAFRLGILLVINPMPDGEFKGGTAIAIPFDAIELKEGETRDPALARIRQSAHLSPDGRLTTVDILLNAKPHRVANAYAPQDDTVRPQFLQDLTDEINDRTILALDANCVPDTTLGTLSRLAGGG